MVSTSSSILITMMIYLLHLIKVMNLIPIAKKSLNQAMLHNMNMKPILKKSQSQVMLLNINMRRAILKFLSLLTLSSQVLMPLFKKLILTFLLLISHLPLEILATANNNDHQSWQNFIISNMIMIYHDIMYLWSDW